MKIVKLEFYAMSAFAYTHREVSSLVNRDGVTDVVVKAADNGLVGWGESCSGANLESVLDALMAWPVRPRPESLGK